MDQHECKTIPNYKTIETAWDAQFLVRYHTVPLNFERQTVGAHSYAVTVLIDQLWPDSSKQLLQAALYHDVPEIILGDIPATAKWDNADLTRAFTKAEEKVFNDLELQFYLSKEEKDKLKMADMLELVMYAHRHLYLGKLMAEIKKTGVDSLNDRFKDNPYFPPVKTIIETLD